ncbi:MAG TPA: hypothetical protein VFV06_08175, partial [Sphingorhabdus sp.]|nr:hypothetical protein [Sphingorhabdus sp.]
MFASVTWQRLEEVCGRATAPPAPSLSRCNKKAFVAKASGSALRFITHLFTISGYHPFSIE